MLTQLWIKLVLLVGLMGLACTSPLTTTQNEPVDAPTRLYYQIGAAWESHEQMRIVWEQVIDAEEPISCAQVLIAPDSFELTVADAEQYPETVSVRDRLNTALSYLATVGARWETECTNQRAFIPIAELRDIQILLDLAESELIEADWLWASIWQL